MRFLIKIPGVKFILDLILCSYISALSSGDKRKEALILAIKSSRIPAEHVNALKYLAWNMREK